MSGEQRQPIGRPTLTTVPRSFHPAISIRHLRDVHVKTRLRQQGCQRECLESIAGDFGMTVDSWFALDHLPASFHVSQERLSPAQGYLNVFRARDDRL